ncbi:TraR/DksA family transcriptional regulator [Streptosporangium sp. H16]|uniref:TraR/DksA family transcriptional regulator n=1 Tax=Streptosporangium sp. H16 TaxID=3444184 RepID=UPI003F7ACD12
MEVHQVWSARDARRRIRSPDAARLLGRDVASRRRPATVPSGAAGRPGTYGPRAHCQGPIPFERLEVRPPARTCIDCQRRHEAA